MNEFDRVLAAPSSPLARIDGLLKLCAALGAVLVISTFPAGLGWRQLAVAAALGSVWAVSRVPGRYVGRRLLAAAPFVAMAATVPVVSGLPDGRLLALAVGWKAGSAVLVFSVLAATTPVEEIVEALRRLGVPRGFALTATLMHRYLFVLLEEWRRVARARECRAAGRVAGGRARAWANQVSMVFVRGWDRADRVAQAMLARGFRGDFPRRPAPRPRVRDLACGAALLLGLLALRIG